MRLHELFRESFVGIAVGWNSSIAAGLWPVVVGNSPFEDKRCQNGSHLFLKRWIGLAQVVLKEMKHFLSYMTTWASPVPNRFLLENVLE